MVLINYKPICRDCAIYFSIGFGPFPSALDDTFLLSKTRQGAGMWYVHVNNSGVSHFMHTESTLIFYSKLLGQCFDARRAKYDLHQRKGMLIADAFTANASQKDGFLECFFLFFSLFCFAILYRTAYWRPEFREACVMHVFRNYCT